MEMEHCHQTTDVPKVNLGSQGLEVSRLGFGCGGLSGVYNSPLPHEEGISLIRQAYNRGIAFFDTSDLYGDNYDNEIMVGKALKQLPREKIQLATKFGCLWLENGEFVAKGTPEYVRKSCEGSLKRLGMDYIDLYYQHRVDTMVPTEQTIAHPRFIGENLEKNKLLYNRLAALSTRHSCCPAQLALAWLFHQGDDIVPIPGTTKLENLVTNIESLKVKLSTDDLKEISEAIPVNEVSGERDPDVLAKLSYKFADTPVL
uniref:NADP-dependent oxidoreductase domain-containing protein n=1 Tax=Chenopodium quinoa TaxID=63459 RepID=A0A803MQS4_CHEQI